MWHYSSSSSAHNPERIYLLGTKEEHIAAAERGLEKCGDVSRVPPVQVELKDLHATDQVARRLASELTRLDALVLSAGLGVGPYSETKDGLDSYMQVNAFGQHHLMMLLLPVLIKTPDSRVVMQSSAFHRLGTSKVQFNDLAEINQGVGAANLENRTKLGQVCLTLALARRQAEGKLGLSPGKPPHFIAVHLGGVNTNQPEQAKEAYGTLGKIGVAAVRPFMKDPINEDCRPALFAATIQDVAKEGLDGVYVVPDRKVTDVADHAKDVELQERSWRLTESTLISKLAREKVEYAI